MDPKSNECQLDELTTQLYKDREFLETDIKNAEAAGQQAVVLETEYWAKRKEIWECHEGVSKTIHSSFTILEAC